MAISLFFLKPLSRFLGIGWSVKFTSGKDSYPCAEYVCPFCKKQDAWITGRLGFNGVAPVAKCCANAVPFPIADEKFAAHLNAKVRWWNGEQPRERFIDTWDAQ